MVVVSYIAKEPNHWIITVFAMFFDGFGTSSAMCVELSIVPIEKAGATNPRMKLTPVGQPVEFVYSVHTKELVECDFGRTARHTMMVNQAPTFTNTVSVLA